MRVTKRQLQFLRNLAAGDATPIKRVGKLFGNLTHRNPSIGCCGNYGEPGC